MTDSEKHETVEPTPDATRDPRPRWRRVVRWTIVAIVGLLVVAQAVPYGRNHSNPPTTAEPAWNTTATRATFMTSCGDCHSNTTRWPWYTNVAPVSWLVQRDVDEGRSKLNVSEWGRQEVEVDEIAEVVRKGEMPPWYYTIKHGDAKLSGAERDRFAEDLTATFRASH